ncbi:MAG TPA: outer membrane beta-barrel protein [Burkholderiales bacterium]|nr:outer membrane beta-barrel protein [Burkholderiales bacterium]
MKITRVLVASLVAAAGLLYGPAAPAQLYVGASAGRAGYDRAITEGLITAGPVEERSLAFKLYGGYHFARQFAVEGGYYDLGKVAYSGAFRGAPVSDGEVAVSGFAAFALGSVPLSEAFSVFGKLGLLGWQVRARDITAGQPFTDKWRGRDLALGAGISVLLKGNMGGRLEWERFKVDDARIVLVSVGLDLRF